jgi:hypothetical protein
VHLDRAVSAQGPLRAQHTEKSVLGDELREWWLKTAATDLEAVAPKAIEYSSSDLLVIGAGIAPWLTPAQQAEAAVGFYALGKASRITGALSEGREPNIDSWDDLAIYAMMGRRIRHAGGWPA